MNTEQEKGTTVEDDIQQKAVSVPLSPPHRIMTRSRTGTVIRPPDRLRLALYRPKGRCSIINMRMRMIM